MTGNVYHRKDGRFEARLPLGKIKNKRIYRSFYGASREEAEKKLISAQNTNKSELTITEMTVKDVTIEYLTMISPRLKESSMANYRMKAEKHIYPAFGEIRCDMVIPADIQDFIAQKLKYGLSVRYVADIVILLKSVFRYANRTYGIRNPTEGIVMPKKPKPEITILNIAEQKHLLKYIGNANDLTSLGIALSLYTGIRIGELCALQWKDIDLDSRTITINKTIQRIKDTSGVRKTKIVITEPKSQSSVRVIPVPDCLMEMLSSFQNKPDIYVLSSGFKPVEPRTMQYRFANILKKGNLPSVHFHSLRHAFATNCIALGFDVKTLSELLGHSSVEVTLNRYVHSSLERKKACMKLLTWAA